MKNTIPKKIPASFIDPNISLLVKMSDPNKILRTPPSLKYVSGAPGKAVNLKTKMGALFSLAKTEIILTSK